MTRMVQAVELQRSHSVAGGAAAMWTRL